MLRTESRQGCLSGLADEEGTGMQPARGLFGTVPEDGILRGRSLLASIAQLQLHGQRPCKAKKGGAKASALAAGYCRHVLLPFLWLGGTWTMRMLEVSCLPFASTDCFKAVAVCVMSSAVATVIFDAMRNLGHSEASN